MVSTQPRITARVDEDTKELLLKASKLIGQPSINAFVLWESRGVRGQKEGWLCTH